MSNLRRKHLNLRILAVFQSIIILILIILLVYVEFIKVPVETSVPASVILDNSKEDGEVRTKAVIEKKETYYQLDGKKILLSDDTYGEIFLPVYKDVPASTLDKKAMVTRNGYTFYKPDSKVTSILGIDVSAHQTSVNWQQVKDAGVQFVMIRVGYRSYGGGQIHIDENFEDNIKGAEAVGINVGVYFFSQAVTTDEAVQEADAVIDAISKYKITYPVVFDWELISDDTARTDNIPVDTLTDCCVSFCERVKSAGYKPMIYQNKRTSLFKLDLPRLTDYDFWLAEYGSTPSYYYNYNMWQYSCTGTIPGIFGDVDLNLSFKDYAAQ
ncbi:MAG: glycoside hydrolase family 25 protein [Ruminococcus sp.]|jgi:GH25 family lysozyme M1 (1,4-beta-N-acetylmuramidase)|nr:glycoside hydrolase family 25 protein [Ruminococcus sp.]